MELAVAIMEPPMVVLTASDPSTTRTAVIPLQKTTHWSHSQPAVLVLRYLEDLHQRQALQLSFQSLGSISLRLLEQARHFLEHGGFLQLVIWPPSSDTHVQFEALRVSKKVDLFSMAATKIHRSHAH